MQKDFRHILKDETRQDHDRVDHLMSEVDLTGVEGLLRFLKIHRVCFQAMLHVAQPGTPAWTGLNEVPAGVEADLTALGVTDPPLAVPPLPPTDALALDYVLEGSRLGTQVLARRWAQSTDPQVQAACSYFTLSPAPGRWRAVCDMLSKVVSPSNQAKVITTDTKRLFAMFYEVTTAHMIPKGQNTELSL